MNFSPPQAWDDGDTWLNNNEDRAGALMIGLFAAILSFWIVPELIKHFRA